MNLKLRVVCLYLRKILTKNKYIMSKVKIICIIYAIGIIIGALFLDVWGAETTPQKSMSIFAWTIIFIIALFFVDKNEKK